MHANDQRTMGDPLHLLSGCKICFNFMTEKSIKEVRKLGTELKLENLPLKNAMQPLALGDGAFK